MLLSLYFVGELCADTEMEKARGGPQEMKQDRRRSWGLYLHSSLFIPEDGIGQQEKARGGPQEDDIGQQEKAQGGRHEQNVNI